MIDLHVHSIYSDGTCSVEEIIEQAMGLGMTQIAITDHNNLKGSIIAHELGEMDTVIGAELTTEYKKAEIHLLSYFPNGSDYKNVNFLLKSVEVKKKIATIETLENLNAMGIEITVSELTEFTSGTVNRVHICKAMMKHGYIESVKEGFEKYVGDNCPAYVASERTGLLEAIDAVHADGGLAVIAHPYEYVDDLDIYEFLEDVAEKIDGIECYHPSATPEQSELLVQFAHDHNKRITGGSDFHGDNKPTVKLGMMNVDDQFRID